MPSTIWKYLRLEPGSQTVRAPPFHTEPILDHARSPNDPGSPFPAVRHTRSASTPLPDPLTLFHPPAVVRDVKSVGSTGSRGDSSAWIHTPASLVAREAPMRSRSHTHPRSHSDSSEASSSQSHIGSPIRRGHRTFPARCASEDSGEPVGSASDMSDSYDFAPIPPEASRTTKASTVHVNRDSGMSDSCGLGAMSEGSESLADVPSLTHLLFLSSGPQEGAPYPHLHSHPVSLDNWLPGPSHITGRPSEDGTTSAPLLGRQPSGASCVESLLAIAVHPLRPPHPPCGSNGSGCSAAMLNFRLRPSAEEPSPSETPRMPASSALSDEEYWTDASCGSRTSRRVPKTAQHAGCML
jgi:hypothetical protein